MSEGLLTGLMIRLYEKENLKEFSEVHIQTSKVFVTELQVEEIEYLEVYVTKLVILKKTDGTVKIYSDADLYFKK